MKLPPIPELAPLTMKAGYRRPVPYSVGSVCVVARISRFKGPGVYRLDRIAATTGEPPFVRITEVASGTPISAWRWIGPPTRAWYAIIIGGQRRGVLRMRDLWNAWVADGQPQWRSIRACRAYVERYLTDAEST